MALLQGEGFVLKIRDFAEADLLVTLFTNQWGKRNAIAKGAKRLNSRLGGVFDLLNYVEFVFYEKPRLDLVSQGALRHGYPELKSELDRVTVALRVGQRQRDQRRARPSLLPVPSFARVRAAQGPVAGLIRRFAADPLPLADLLGRFWFRLPRVLRLPPDHAGRAREANAYRRACTVPAEPQRVGWGAARGARVRKSESEQVGK